MSIAKCKLSDKVVVITEFERCRVLKLMVRGEPIFHAGTLGIIATIKKVLVTKRLWWTAIALIRVTAVDALIHIELTYFLRIAICVLLAIRSSNAGSVIDAALERGTATVVVALALNTLAIV